MRSLDKIIIHCSATRAGWMDNNDLGEKVDEIRRWHTDRNWSDIGYHFLIDRNGDVADGRPLKRIGAHVRGHNVGSIGICLIGGHGSSADDPFLNNFTIAQWQALVAEIDSLRDLYGPMTIHGHNEFAAKACPGFRVSKYLTLAGEAPKW